VETRALDSNLIRETGYIMLLGFPTNKRITKEKYKSSNLVGVTKSLQLNSGRYRGK